MASHPLILRVKFGLHRSRATAAFDSGMDQWRAGDMPGARRLLLEAAGLGHRDAMFRVACMYEEAQGGSGDPAEAVKWFEVASSSGDAMATLRLATLVWAGSGVQQDTRRSIALLSSAATAGLAAAQTALGMAYLDGVGVEVDAVQAAHWLRLAAQQRHGLACTSLAILFENGRGVQQNLEQAFVWQFRAAEQGEVLGQYNLARLYAQGIGVAADPRAAVTWFTRAALQGDPDSAFNLGRHQLRGEGTPRDPTAAAAWFEKSAAAGNALAAAYLAGLYADGDGVQRDLERALVLLDTAEARGLDVQDTRALVLKSRQDDMRIIQSLGAAEERPSGTPVEVDDPYVGTWANRQACFFAFHLFPEWLFRAWGELGRLDRAALQDRVSQLWSESKRLAQRAPLYSSYVLEAPACSEFDAGGCSWTLINMPKATLPPEPRFLLFNRSAAQGVLVLLEVGATGGASHVLAHINAQETHAVWGTAREERAEGIAAALQQSDRPEAALDKRIPANLLEHLSMYVELRHECTVARSQ